MLELPCNTVIVAIGQKIEDGLSGIVHNPVTFQSENPKVFVAGDLASGARTVVEAMAQGKEAAISINRILNGEDPEYGRRNGRAVEIDFSPDWSRARSRARVAAPVLPKEERKGFDEMAHALSYEHAVAEAERCLGCGIPFGLRTCWFCLPCEIECPEQALHVEIPYLLR
jgi:NADPH-dependent glutamate synthase beta subunit-like oxidoreductase